MPPTQRLVIPGRLHHSKAFEAPGVPGKRPLTVYLPPGYEHSRSRYPVAYFFDGQNLFGDAGSFSGGWHLHTALDELAAKGKQVPIVIGIHHGGATRGEELTPWGLSRGQNAHGDALLDWVTGPLQAMVAEEMRVLRGPEHTMIGGSSLGGLMALYAACRHPEAFGHCLAMSPSIWVQRGAILQVVRQTPLRPDARVYLDCGGREPGFRQAEALAATLGMKGLREGDRLMWRPDAKGVHNERHWRRRLPKALRFFYAPPK
jgi:predicted alpha/beta superfamily hydrolase